jgi:hypothetical protein
VRAMQIIQRQFQVDLPRVHLARLRLVFAATFTALRCGRLSLTALGRAIAERTTHKHGIKRIDRLLGNTHLHEERIVFFTAIARRVISPGSRPPIIVDWTAVTPNLWALVAAVSFNGRALTIYAETHPISRYGKPYVHAAFLNRLVSVLPLRCVPVILADAGFRSPFMKMVARLGWDYVIRLRMPLAVRHQLAHGFQNLPRLWALTQTRPMDFGLAELGLKVRYCTRVVGVRHAVKHRKYRSRRLHANISRHRREAQEPWILATSLAIESSRIVALYARRMQIEETFRDAKNPRFGLSLSLSGPRSPDRADVLLLLASLAHLCALLLGMAAENAQLRRGFQANTVSTRRVLSLAMLGRFLLGSRNDSVVATAFNRRSWISFRARVAGALPY